MIKKIKLGLSATVAFALMFATSINVQAQEKAALSKRNIEFIEATGVKSQTAIGDNRTDNETKAKVATTQWYFQGTQQAQVFNPNFWDTTAPSEPCSDATLTLPCLYETPIPMVDSEELIDHLEEEYGTDVSSVAQNATTRKAESSS